MKRLLTAVLSSLVLVAGLLVGAAAPASAAPTPSDNPEDWVNVYSGEISSKQLDALYATGVDRHELRLSPGSSDATVRVEAALPGVQAAELIAGGLDLVRIETAARSGDASASRLQAQAVAPPSDGYAVWRKYGSDNGLKNYYEELAAAYPDITKVVTIGQTTLGQDIIAVKVTRNAERTRDGRRPATVFNAAQHAREWITPEMNRRLFTYVLNGYGNDDTITDLLNRTELWFIPVANPDGYDWTFEDGQRLWRKNLRDNNGDGQITAIDGVDLNRNWATNWGYDNEGSSPNPASSTYRGPAPGSEPETQAQESLVQTVQPEFFVNYHSAAELLLYGVGWQVATPSPDDVVYEAMAGNDVIGSAIPGYDPDISAELYTTNGETTDHLHATYDVLAFTPEMSTCEVAVERDPDDEWTQEDCAGGSGFTFPDSEALVQQEFENNIPFAIATAQSALDPDDPVSVLGIDTPSLVADPFEVSYGDPQPVAVWAKRDARALRLNYSVNGGRVQRERVAEWEGGSRYGIENDVWYAEFRGEVTGTAPGDSVEVWFEAVVPREGRVESEHFTYTVASDSDAPALVLANEDYTGVNPTYDPAITAPKYAAAHQQALADAGYASDVYDVDAQGVPHDLGVLSHFDSVLWYLGDNRYTQDPEDEILEYGSNRLPDSAVAERQQFLTIAVRDYMNAGGNLLHAGETAQSYGFLSPLVGLGGIYYGLDDDPSAECVVTVSADQCLILSDDFSQYWLGAYNRTEIADAPSVFGTAEPFEGAGATFGGPATVDNPIDEAGVFAPTSNYLDPAQFPWFGESTTSMNYTLDLPESQPIEGEWYVGQVHADDAYMRLTRTIDVPAGATSAQLQFQLSYSMEESYDNVIVEAHTVGQDDWTTLPDVSADPLTTQDTPADCAEGPNPGDDSFLIELHPWLDRYLSGEPCEPVGRTGEWHAFTGDSGGWQDVAVDLTAYAGSPVEVSISYVTDPAFGAVGVFIDDTRVVIDGAVVEAEGFETGLGAWSLPGSPEGSPPNFADFERAQALVEAAAAITNESPTGPISILLGFGLEQIASAEERAAVVGRAMGYLID